MKKRVFVVENEAVVARDICGHLQRMNYDIAGMASSGEDAMSVMGESKPDVVLMGVDPGDGMDGIEAAARIKERFRIPVVFLTAFSDTELVARIRHTEPFAYVLKPFEEAELHAAVEIALANRILEEREREYRMLLEQAAAPMAIADATGRIVAVNLRVCELLGHSREELLAMKLMDLIDPEQLLAEPPHFEELKDGRTHMFERRLVCHDGRRVDCEISARGMSDGRIQGILHDITERKRDEAEFRQAVRSEAVDKLLTKLHAMRHGESAAVNLNRLALFLENISSLRMPLTGSDSAGLTPMHRFRTAAQEFDQAHRAAFDADRFTDAHFFRRSFIPGRGQAGGE